MHTKSISTMRGQLNGKICLSRCKNLPQHKKCCYVRQISVYYDKLIKLRNIDTAIFLISDMAVLEMMFTMKKKNFHCQSELVAIYSTQYDISCRCTCAGMKEYGVKFRCLFASGLFLIKNKD